MDEKQKTLLDVVDDGQKIIVLDSLMNRIEAEIRDSQSCYYDHPDLSVGTGARVLKVVHEWYQGKGAREAIDALQTAVDAAAVAADSEAAAREVAEARAKLHAFFGMIDEGYKG